MRMSMTSTEGSYYLKGNQQSPNILESLEDLFKIYIFEKTDLENRVDNHSVYLISDSIIIPIIEEAITSISEEFRIAILFFVEENKETLKLKKIISPFENTNLNNNKYQFNITNSSYSTVKEFLYDEKLLEINFPINIKPTSIKKFDF